MPSTTARCLTLSEASKIIHRTDQPSADEVAFVRRELETGALQGKRKGATQWIISTEQVAEYLANRAMQTRSRLGKARSSAASKGMIRASAMKRDSSELRGVYHNIFKDYFLAVMLRRRLDGASRNFGRTVLVGQVVLLIGLAWGIFAALRSTVLAPLPPERQAVETWIASQSTKYAIEKWFPTQSDDDDDFVTVRVRYRYFTHGGKSIDSDRSFRVEGNRATPHDGEE